MRAAVGQQAEGRHEVGPRLAPLLALHQVRAHEAERLGLAGIELERRLQMFDGVVLFAQRPQVLGQHDANGVVLAGRVGLSRAAGVRLEQAHGFGLAALVQELTAEGEHVLEKAVIGVRKRGDRAYEAPHEATPAQQGLTPAVNVAAVCRG